MSGGYDGMVMVHRMADLEREAAVSIHNGSNITSLALDTVREEEIGDMYMSHPRQLIFLWKSVCLVCAVLLCLLFVRPSLLLSSFLLISLTCTMYIHVIVYNSVY